ncbi:MAG: sigma-70 family RNA polymerase sigma factor [Alphaproteobacteria bacterium]|nr:sigma-70 family RNA polymerase sigma factor [Alphaproteobacteria bacterium]
MLVTLNWAQEEALSAIADNRRADEKKLYVDMPTRSGKTGVFLSLLEHLAQQKELPSTTIITDRQELVKNILKDASLFAPTLVQNNLIQSHTSSSLKALSTPPLVRVMTYIGYTAAIQEGTLSPEKERLIIEDEGQHGLSDLRLNVLNRNPKIIHLAFTASPEYSLTKGLSQSGYERAYFLSRQRAIEGKLNAQTRNIIVKMKNVKGNLDNIPSNAGKYSAQHLEKLVRQTSVMKSLGQFIAHWQGSEDTDSILKRSGFIFCSSIADSIATAKYLNKRFGEGFCGAVWGNMGANQDGIIRSHEKGEIRFLASADFAVEGFGKNHHDVVLNKVPSKSAVRVKQRGGRVTGYDKNNPDKEALIVDFIFPSDKGDQLLYGDAEDGFLFVSSNIEEKRYPGIMQAPNIKPEPLIKGLEIYSTPEQIERFLDDREEKRLQAGPQHLINYQESVRKRMIETGIISFSQIWNSVQNFVNSEERIDPERYKKTITKNRVLRLMKGDIDPEHSKFREYNETAIALAAALRTHARVLFGPIRTPKNKAFIKPMRPIDHKSDIDNDFKINPTFTQSSHSDTEESDIEELDFTNPDFKILAEQELLREQANTTAEDFEASEAWKNTTVSILGKHKKLQINKKLRPNSYLDPQGSCDVNIMSDTTMFLCPDIPSPHEVWVQKELRNTFEKCFKTLEPREVKILQLSYGMDVLDIDVTTKEVAKFFNISYQRVHQIEKKARVKLRHPSRSRALKPFLS